MYRIVVLDGESGITVDRNQVCVAGTRLNSKDRLEHQTTPFTLSRPQCILPDQNTLMEELNRSDVLGASTLSSQRTPPRQREKPQAGVYYYRLFPRRYQDRGAFAWMQGVRACSAGSFSSSVCWVKGRWYLARLEFWSRRVEWLVGCLSPRTETTRSVLLEDCGWCLSGGCRERMVLCR